MPFQLWRNITMMVCLDVWSGTPSLITLTRLRLLLKVSLARLFFAIAKRKILQVLHFILELFNLLNAKLYEGCSECRRNSQAKPDFPNLSDAHSIHDPLPLNSREKLILDVEMDMNGGSIDVDRLGIDGSQTTGSSVSLVNQKLNFLSIISSFFPILSLLTWEIMFNLREKENDHKYLKNFLCILSRHPHWSSCRHILDLSNGVGTQNTVASSFTKRESEEVACQPCAALVKSHFVHIFSVCMAMHCSKKAGWERGSRVLETSILLIVHISEHERDELINKKELVAFPDFDIFNEIQDLHQKIRQTYSPRVHLLNFVKRPHYVPPRLLLCSLDNTNDLSAMVSDFISKIGIGDPHCVVFHLPGDYSVPVFGIAIGMQRLTSMQIRASRKKLFESYEASKEVSDG
ncbi:uncharacterized protein LOC142547741 isoform X7 [Primulina tabacum]|uniref:uncharacterized protein LOC142547741 isoform X7 n=1 Tax=Primulina tabacum TaxID=48773 RepID=UPI003F5A478B